MQLISTFQQDGQDKSKHTLCTIRLTLQNLNNTALCSFRLLIFKYLSYFLMLLSNKMLICENIIV